MEQQKIPKKSIINSFNHAISGVIHSFKMERNMKIHVALAVLVIVAALITNITRFEMIALTISIAFVFFAELFNTSVEAVVDILMEKKYSELAKIAKDVSAGGVLIAAFNALIVGFLVFFRKLYNLSFFSTINLLSNMPAYVMFAALLIVFVAVILIKSRSIKRGGSYVQGGMPSGHTAFAFSLFTAIAFVTLDPVATTFAAMMALIVAESRMETKVHTFAEVAIGGLLGIVITVIVFKLAQSISF